jgi:uncharacterized protein YbbC (DUF1343 family)/CubicO group peptidase (beta-lactamase class C family)
VKRTLCSLAALLATLSSISSASQANTTAAFAQMDVQIEDAVRSGLIPGAVLAVGHNGQIVYQKAYGSSALVPQREPMTLDTIFDIASLSKVVSTTPCIMKLVEQGKLRLDDPVTKYLPEFQGGKSDITVRLLMTHFSGLAPDVELVPRWSGYREGIQRALTTKPVAPPGVRFIYSDINFLLLGEIVSRLSGMTLPEFAAQEIFKPLGMVDTQYQPPASLLARIAPTEIDKDTHQPLRGNVHDPTSRYMGGIAGHAGVFSTAADLSRYAEMLLNQGESGGIRIFQPATVKKFTEPATPADQPILRALGWDMDSPYSSNRGELYPIGSYGHTGYTGTSMWLDPQSNSFVILLTNVVHPNGIKSLTSLRSRVATIAAASFGNTLPQTIVLTGYRETIEGAGVHRVINRTVETETGLDVLEETGFAPLKGKRIGLITNQTGVDHNGQRNIDAMRAAGVDLRLLFSPEHGISGKQDEDVANGRDQKTGLPVVSLFQPNQRRIPAASLDQIDALVFDIQDAGARFYTYSCTLLYSVEEAAKAHKPIFVLDRPNPITGTHVEGPMLDDDARSFIGCYNMPVRHGLTLGELAGMANTEQHWGADLRVIAMKNWERGDWFDSSSLRWIDPSPNLRSLNGELLYPGLALLEADTNYSVGRGTDAPFEQIGATWIDGRTLAEKLNSRFIPGVRAYPTRFRPASSNFANQEIEGVRFVVTDREAFDSTRLGLEIALALNQLFPGHLDLEKCHRLIGSEAIIGLIKQGRDPSTVWSAAQREAEGFADRRRPFLLY